MFLVMLVWLPWAANSYSKPCGPTPVIRQPIGTHAPAAPAVVLRLAAAIRRTLPAWVWRPWILWYELSAIIVLALWTGTRRVDLGATTRIAFWLAVVNPFLPLLLAVLTLGAWG